jgi:hypothetical protein
MEVPVHVLVHGLQLVPHAFVQQRDTLLRIHGPPPSFPLLRLYPVFFKATLEPAVPGCG